MEQRERPPGAKRACMDEGNRDQLDKEDMYEEGKLGSY